MDILTPLTYVKELLKKNEHLRDDDNKLVANYWYKELQNSSVNTNSFTAHDFLNLYANGNMTPADSITRARRKLQEQFPELRGKNWKERQKHTEKVKKQLYETPEFYIGGSP